MANAAWLWTTGSEPTVDQYLRWAWARYSSIVDAKVCFASVVKLGLNQFRRFRKYPIITTKYKTPNISMACDAKTLQKIFVRAKMHSFARRWFSGVGDHFPVKYQTFESVIANLHDRIRDKRAGIRY